MTNATLAKSYLSKATKRLKILAVLLEEAAYSDVVREAQEIVDQEIDRLADISAWLRKEREFSFCGDIDFIPTEQYSVTDAQRAIDDARFVVSVVESVIPTPD